MRLPQVAMEMRLQIAYFSRQNRSLCLWTGPSMLQPLVAVSTDVRQFDNYTWHAAPQQYLEAAIAGAGVFPVLVPSFGDRLDLDQLLASVDGVMVTGSKSNVHPSLYGGDASEANGPYDPARDATTLPLIRKAIELRRAAAGDLPRHPGTERGARRHAGDRNPGARRARSTTARRSATIRTSASPSARAFRSSPAAALPACSAPARSWSIPCTARPSTGSGSRLQVEAVAEDGTVEAVSVKDARAFAVGVQWHPEYWVHSDGNSAKIFRAFGDAVRAHAVARTGARTAAE